MSAAPRRTDGIEINEVADGFVAYDPANDRVHYLNHTAALILEFCTGANTESEITQLLGSAYDLPEPPTVEVAECLTQLRDENLVT